MMDIIIHQRCLITYLCLNDKEFILFASSLNLINGIGMKESKCEKNFLRSGEKLNKSKEVQDVFERKFENVWKSLGWKKNQWVILTLW